MASSLAATGRATAQPTKLQSPPRSLPKLLSSLLPCLAVLSFSILVLSLSCIVDMSPRTGRASSEPWDRRRGEAGGEASTEAGRAWTELCGPRWMGEYKGLHDQIRASTGGRERSSTGEKAGSFLERADGSHGGRYITFAGDSPEVSGLADTLLGLVSTFIVALMEKRALIITHPCVLAAFDPASVDWRPSYEIPLDPLRIVDPADGITQPWRRMGSLEVEPGSQSRLRQEGSASTSGPCTTCWGAAEGEVVALNWLQGNDYKYFQRLPEFFASLSNASNIVVQWNRGRVVKMLSDESHGWHARLLGLGLRMPYAFGCIIRFLLRPKPEVASATEAYEQSLFANASVCVGVHVRVPDESSWTHRGQPTAGTPNPHFAQSQSHSSRLQEQAVLEKLRRALRDPTPVTRRHRRRARSKRRARGAREDAGLATGYGTPGAPASPVAPGSAGTGVSSVLGSSQEIQIPEATVGSRPAHRRFLTGRHQSRGWSSPSVPIDGLRAAHGAFKCAKRVEHFYYPPSVPVRWLLLSSSLALRQALQELDPDKIFTTDIRPQHLQYHWSSSTGGKHATDSQPQSQPQEQVQPQTERQSEFHTLSQSAACRDIVAEWLLFSRCHKFVFGRGTGFSKTAAMYAMRPLSVFLDDSCDPEEPTRMETLGLDHSGL